MIVIDGSYADESKLTQDRLVRHSFIVPALARQSNEERVQGRGRDTGIGNRPAQLLERGGSSRPQIREELDELFLSQSCEASRSHREQERGNRLHVAGAGERGGDLGPDGLVVQERFQRRAQLRVGRDARGIERLHPDGGRVSLAHR